MTHCFKILRLAEWERLDTEGVFAGSPADLADGFVHLSLAHQVAATARKHFAGEGRLKLLALSASDLGDALRMEPSRGGDLFPHLFRPLVAADVLWAADVPFRDGEHVFPDLSGSGLPMETAGE